MGGFVSNAIEDIGNIGQGAIDAVGDLGAGLDRTVRDVVPGGWTTAALLAAGYYYQPEIAAFMNAEGAVVPAAEVAGGASGVASGSGAVAGTAGGVASGAGAGGSMFSMGQIGSAMQIAGGINSLTGGAITNALGGSKAVSQATNAADPMAPYRQNLAAMYAGALQPGTNLDLTQMPGYSQFETGVLNPALEASKRSSAASGMLRSGNEQIALQKIGQQGYSGFMTDYLNRLAAGSGVAQSPVAGYNAGTQAQTGIMQGIGGIGTGIAGIFGKGSTPTDYGYTVDTSGYGIGSGGMGTVNTADYGGASGYSIR